MKNAPKLPSLPKLKSVVRCACGCDGLTQSRFVPGHDSKLYGMIKRIKADGDRLPDCNEQRSEMDDEHQVTASWIHWLAGRV